MHSYTCHPGTALDDGAVNAGAEHTLPTEGRQEGRMYVDHPTPPRPNDALGDQPHIPGENDQIGAELPQAPFQQIGLVFGASRDQHGNPGLLGSPHGSGVGATHDKTADRDAADTISEPVDQRLEVAAAT
jgi:hypothetical protein